MDSDGPFDRRLRRLRRDRAARREPPVGYLAALTGGELLERLALVTVRFDQALLLGCGELAPALRERGIATMTADPGFRFARAFGGVQCDEDRLPFADGAFDLVLASGTLDTVNDLPGALALIRRALRPDGLLLAAFAGAGSLPRLKAAMLAADLEESSGASPRIHPQIDVRAAGDLLARAGLRMPVADSHAVTVRFASLDGLVDDLRGTAATNMLARPSRSLGRIGLAAARRAFAAQADPDGKVGEQLEILYLTAWAPPA